MNVTVGYAQDRLYSWVGPAALTLHREQLTLVELAKECRQPLDHWAVGLGGRIIEKECERAVIFTADAGLVACVLNKMPTLRAVAVSTIAQAGKATLTLAANVLVVEMPGRTFFEVRQVLRELCLSSLPCPDGVALTLRELEGHAHR